MGAVEILNELLIEVISEQNLGEEEASCGFLKEKHWSQREQELTKALR